MLQSGLSMTIDSLRGTLELVIRSIHVQGVDQVKVGRRHSPRAHGALGLNGHRVVEHPELHRGHAHEASQYLHSGTQREQ